MAIDIYPVIDFVKCLIARVRTLGGTRAVVNVFTVIVCSLSLISSQFLVQLSLYVLSRQLLFECEG